MCGFIGYISKKNSPKNKKTEIKFRKYFNFLSNRGPDFKEEKKILNFDNLIHVGFSRLAIQDVSSKSNKIFHNKDKMILFNGEIYNFKELKNEYFFNKNFETNSDTELLFNILEKFGTNIISKLKGIFSIVYFDFVKNEVYFIRDYTGTKPLYYLREKDFFAFSSEAWFLYSLSEKEINKNTLNFFLNFGFTKENETLIKNVKKIIPRKIYKFKLKDNKFESKEFLNINLEKKSALPKQSYLNKKIQDTIESNLVSDTKVGTFLSGGIDSSIVTLLAKKFNDKVESFTTVYLPKKKFKKFNVDFEYAKRVSSENNIKLNTYYVEDEKDFFRDFVNVTNYLDEPISNLNFLNTYWQSKLAKQMGFKVVLTGDGADELFCGYDRYHRLFLAKNLKIFGFLSKRVKEYNNLNINEIPLWFYSIFKNLDSSKILNHEMSQKDLLSLNYFDNSNFDNKVDYINYFDFRYWLTNESNYKLDKCSMINSVEARVPFQDVQLIKDLFFINNKSKFSFLNRKFLLKKNNFIPKYIKERPKTGWFTPERIFLDTNLEKIKNIYFEDHKIKQQGIFNNTELANLFKSYSNNGYLIKRIISTVILFQIWYDRVLNLD